MKDVGSDFVHLMRSWAYKTMLVRSQRWWCEALASMNAWIAMVWFYGGDGQGRSVDRIAR